MNAFAGESASLVSGRVSVSAAESLHVSTGTTGSLGFETGSVGLTADGDVSVASSSDVSVGGRTVRVSSAEDVDVTSGSDLRLSSGGEIEVVSGSGVVGRVADSVEMVAGGVSLSSGSSMDVVGGDMSMSSDGSVTGYATGGVEVGASSVSGLARRVPLMGV